MILALHSIASVICMNEEEKEHMHPCRRDVARLYHLFNQDDVHKSLIPFKSEKLTIKVYKYYFRKCQ